MGYELIAAVDLGSNSFRLQVGRVVGDQIYPLDAIKEPVRLASGLTPGKVLDAASQQRALQWACTTLMIQFATLHVHHLITD